MQKPDRPIKGSLSILAAIFAVAGSAAHASQLSESDEARSSMRRVISCTVDYNISDRRGQGVLAVIEGEFKGKAFAQFHAEIDYCMWLNSFDGRWMEKLGYTTSLLKGQVYRSLVLSEIFGGPKKALLPEFRRLASLPRDASGNPLGAFGVCVAALDPQNARKAITGPTAGPLESAAYAALGPSMSQCVAPGERVAFSKQVLEGALAEGLFVLKFATPAKSSVGKTN